MVVFKELTKPRMVEPRKPSVPANKQVPRIIPYMASIAVLVMVAAFAAKAVTHRHSKRLLIAVIPMATTDEYWKSIHAGAVKAAKEIGVDILWKGPITYDRNEQLDVVENVILKHPDGLVLAPTDSNAARPGVENSIRSGIPVVIVDSNLNSNRQISYVATDNYKGGYLAAEYLAKLLHDKGNVLLFRGRAGNASVENREKGFLDALQKFPQIKLVSSNQRIGTSYEESYKSAENLINRFKSVNGKPGIDGLFCPNETSTFVMLRALQDNGLIGKVRFVGFDTSRKLNDALYSGQIDCLVVQNPILMGYLGVLKLVDHLRGKVIPRQIDTGVTLATTQNAYDPKVQELLEPNLKKLLHE